MQLDETEIKAIVEKLGNSKKDFLNDLESSINSYISSKSWEECLTIVQIDSEGNVKSTWEPKPSEEYLERFWLFINKKKFKEEHLEKIQQPPPPPPPPPVLELVSYEPPKPKLTDSRLNLIHFFTGPRYKLVTIEYDLDSKLTSGVIQLVIDKFQAFYSSDSFSKLIAEKIIKDKAFAEILAIQITEVSRGFLPTAVKKQFTAKLAGILDNSTQSIQQGIIDTTGAVVHGVVNTVIATSISQSVIAVMINNVAHFLHGVIAHVLATTAIKTTLINITKKYVVTKLIAIVLALAPNLVPFLGTMPAWAILLPIVAGFIAYQISSLPEKMGTDVSHAIIEELNGNFEEMNTNVVNQIMGDLTKETLSSLAVEIAQNLSNDSTFQDNLNEL